MIGCLAAIVIHITGFDELAAIPLGCVLSSAAFGILAWLDWPPYGNAYIPYLVAVTLFPAILSAVFTAKFRDSAHESVR